MDRYYIDIQETFASQHHRDKRAQSFAGFLLIMAANESDLKACKLIAKSNVNNMPPLGPRWKKKKR